MLSVGIQIKPILYKGMIEEKDGRQDNEIEFLHRTRK